VEVDLGPRSHGQTVRVHLGDVIAIRLAETPTTGYRWLLAEPPPSLRVVDNRYQAPLPAQPGAAGERLLRIRAQRPGVAIVRLTKQRPWAEGDIGGDYVVTIEIER
jgi:predicted secreted protein